MYYLRINEKKFGFVTDELHKIIDTDIKITEQEYNEFFELQGQGKKFRVKEIPTGIGLFDYIEEYIPQVISDTTLTIEDRMKALEIAFLEVL